MSHELEYRKVQIAGGSTYTVSLPKEWATGHGIRNGDRIALRRQSDGSLVVTPTSTSTVETRPAELDATKLEGATLLRTLLGFYLSGEDAILVRARPRLSSGQREVVRRYTRICVGPEIVEETGDSVLVRDLVNPREFNLPNALSRVQLITHSMVQDALAVLRERDPELAKDVQSRDDEVDRLHRLVAKRFTKMLAGGPGASDSNVSLLEAMRIHQVSRLLERCADHASNVAELSALLKGKSLRADDASRLERLGDRTEELLARAFRSYRRADHADANRVVDGSRKLLSEKGRLREALYAYGPQASSTLSLLVESLERIHQYASDIAEVALNAPPGSPSR